MLAKGFGFASLLLLLLLLFAVGFDANIGFDVGSDVSVLVDATRLIAPNGFGVFDDNVVGSDFGLEVSGVVGFGGAVDTSGVLDATILIAPNGLDGFETDDLLDAETGGAAMDVATFVEEWIDFEDGVDFVPLPAENEKDDVADVVVVVIVVVVVVVPVVKVFLEGTRLILAKEFEACFFAVAAGTLAFC